jgi:hypothetical protein
MTPDVGLLPAEFLVFGNMPSRVDLSESNPLRGAATGRKATIGDRCYSPDEDVVNRLNPSPKLWFLFTAAQTQHLRALAARELL